MFLWLFCLTAMAKVLGQTDICLLTVFRANGDRLRKSSWRVPQNFPCICLPVSCGSVVQVSVASKRVLWRVPRTALNIFVSQSPSEVKVAWIVDMSNPYTRKRSINHMVHCQGFFINNLRVYPEDPSPTHSPAPPEACSQSHLSRSHKTRLLCQRHAPLLAQRSGRWTCYSMGPAHLMVESGNLTLVHFLLDSTILNSWSIQRQKCVEESPGTTRATPASLECIPSCCGMWRRSIEKVHVLLHSASGQKLYCHSQSLTRHLLAHQKFHLMKSCIWMNIMDQTTYLVSWFI